MIIDCYHGTTLSRALSIEKNGFIHSNRPRMWLGTGTYFYQDGFDLCLSWAEQTCKRPSAQKDDKPVVINAKINTEYGIDLIENTYWPVLREIYDEHKAEWQSYSQNGVDTLVRELTPEEYKLDFHHPLDHSIIDTLVAVEANNRDNQGVPAPTMVRAAFMEGQAVDRRSWLFDSAAVIVSVIDHSCIEDIKLIF